ncbi:hypothetical protein [Yoonia sediminilitoris]|uniref:Uncharacterized protein n=1 Tax=Yoonia sediminilitoris TaxID=1286148 RepID=A0A2T6KIX3_9RHOB|nr:hypothetical protein [Yoonia sediminilitoris]PUB15673.1 hypothetical protein C8N45_104293 [Yoonia sediminilitoris]RCW96282.1 hypothetical protein DFP92_104292 [Yoonia sediminilitoris]
MLKPLIAGIAAISLTFAAPGQAVAIERNDAAALLLGVAAIAALKGGQLQLNQREAEPAQQINDWSRLNHSSRANRQNRWSNQHRRHSAHENGRVVPYRCMRAVETRFGIHRMFGRRCLERNYRHVQSLPQRCAVRVYSNNGPRRGFDPLCLREQGYRSDRRRN